MKRKHTLDFLEVGAFLLILLSVFHAREMTIQATGMSLIGKILFWAGFIVLLIIAFCYHMDLTEKRNQEDT